MSTLYSTPSSSVFAELICLYPTWPVLSAFLASEIGGGLRIDDLTTPGSPFALIRYMKGKSNMGIPHVGAFRSVVWNTMEHKPVSVTPFKSEEGEIITGLSNLSASVSAEGFIVEQFIDGVLIGQFWDKYSETWRIHTRTTLDAKCRYFSNTKTFAEMFGECSVSIDDLDKNCCYSYIMQHPENRIVCSVSSPRAVLVQRMVIEASSNHRVDNDATLALRLPGLLTWDAIYTQISMLNALFGHNVQGIVVKSLVTGHRWKLRTSEYNRVRLMRGNSARLDFLWLSLWHTGKLADYIAIFPEERLAADATVNRWKRATNDVYHIYGSVFKARTLPKSHIPPKYRPLVYGLHTLYMDALRPAGMTVDWKTTVAYMNERDVAQMLFVINWELRMAAKQLGVPSIPFESPVSLVSSEAVETQRIRSDFTLPVVA